MSSLERFCGALLVACLALVVVPAAAGAATGSISGTVKDAVTLEGVEGVKVCAWSLEAGEEEEFGGCVNTETNGSYFFGGLQAGEYGIEFWSQRRYQVQFYDHQTHWSEVDPVVVAAATTTEDIDADLQPTSQIDGTVTASAGGFGIGDVEVCAWSLQAGEEEFGDCTETGPDGSYAVKGLEAGEYGIEFWPWEGNFLPQFYNHKANWSEADPVSVGEGEVISGIDAQLDPGGTIAGRITSAATGAPLEEIEVCSFDAPSGEPWRCGWSDAQGSYELQRLPPGQYKVGFALEEGDAFATQFWNNQPTFATADAIPLAIGQTVAGIDARLGSPPPVMQPPAVVTAPVPPVVRKPVRKRCRKGLKRKKVKGRYRCVKPRKHRHRHHHRVSTRPQFRAVR